MGCVRSEIENFIITNCPNELSLVEVKCKVKDFFISSYGEECYEANRVGIDFLVEGVCNHRSSYDFYCGGV